MVTDQQVRRLIMLIKKDNSLAVSVTKAGMDEKTGRKYIKLGKLPSECVKVHIWKTREDPFTEVWNRMRKYLVNNPGLEAKTLFEFLQKEYPGKFSDGQIRTFQRKVKIWRATEGNPKEVFFPQKHIPGILCASDFTHMTELGITIAGQEFSHLIYHFVLTYSNWEIGSVCFSESYESLSEGLQNALWELGGVPIKHRTDCLTAAVHKECNPKDFTNRYLGLLRHYKIQPSKIQPGKANENGDIEQRHYRFKKAVEQSLMLRGSKNFSNRKEYNEFLYKLFIQLNAGRQKRLEEELSVLQKLPVNKLDTCKRFRAKVGPSSTIRVLHNTYSVDSRLIREYVQIKAYAQYIEVWYGQKQVDSFPRLRGENKYAINYRHIIYWLVRKPGAFDQYKYRQDLFPSTIFRLTYDNLCRQNIHTANKQYLEILYLAAQETEIGVENILKYLFEQNKPITVDIVKELLDKRETESDIPEIQIQAIDLGAYDQFLNRKGVFS